MKRKNFMRMKNSSYLLYRSVTLLDGIIDGSGGVADLTHLGVVLIADLLLRRSELGDVGVVTLLHRPQQENH